MLFCCVLLPKITSFMASQPTRPECTPTPRNKASLSPDCLRGYVRGGLVDQSSFLFCFLLWRLNQAINGLLFLEGTFQQLGPRRYFTGTLPGICLLLVPWILDGQKLQTSTNKNLKMEIGNMAIISCILPSSYSRLGNPAITTSDFTYN